MNPGRLREPITVEKPSVTADAHRSPTGSTTWQMAFETKAEVSLDNQKTDIVGGRENPQQRATFLVRRRPEYEEGWRIKWDGKTYEIEAIRHHDSMRRYLEISAVYDG